ncbi:MAG: hypothetical protein M3Y65_21155 [Pseudomonadota bacterium]|nr:hypothetical protein [Pseudomonadota bacterium]
MGGAYDSFYAQTPLEGTGYRIFEGMPYFLRDLRPQGFLGWMAPGKHRELNCLRIFCAGPTSTF